MRLYQNVQRRTFVIKSQTWNLLRLHGQKIVYRCRKKDLMSYFKKENNLLVCCNVSGLIMYLNVDIVVLLEGKSYFTSWWQFSCFHSCCCAVKMKETSDITCGSWQICGDIKAITILALPYTVRMGQPCYYEIRMTRSYIYPIHIFVDRSKIILSLLHIKLSLLKNSINIINRRREGFEHLRRKFPHQS